MLEDTKDLFNLGAEPIDITAARLLWKSPWWAKPLESIQHIPSAETIDLRILGTLIRDCRNGQKHKVGGMQEFCHLVTMALKIRWKFPDDLPEFDQHYLERLKVKLSKLEWNPSIKGFEFKHA